MKHILYEGVFARYLQFLPETHHGAVCLRAELFGVKLMPGEYRFYFLYNVHVGCSIVTYMQYLLYLNFVGLFKVFFHKVSK